MENNNVQKLNKKISFIVYYPYQWFIYKNIYNKLPADKREVIVDLSAHPGLQDDGVKANIISLLQKENASFRMLDRVDHFNVEYFRDFFLNVEVMVSCWELGCVSSEYTTHIKKVNTTYGLAKELTMVRPSRSLYDVILAYGGKDQRYFSLLTKSIAIGNPRLDNFYKKTVDASVQEKISLYFRDKKKKTILYVPTHGDLGSFCEMLPTLEQLSKQYNIIFKPHYYTLREDKDIVEKYRQIKSILVIDDSWDTIEVMTLSDIIVSDNSSAIFDAMQVDKPLIVCDFLDKFFLDVIHKNLRLAKRGLAGALTYSDSLEQEVKSKSLVAIIKNPKELGSILENIEEIDSLYKNFRREIVRDHFAYIDGHSAERAAKIIMDVYNTERKHVQGILHHSYLAYNNRIYRGIIESEKKEVVLSDSSNVAIVWIFCELGSDQDEILGTLYLALSEKEVPFVCVSGSVGRDIIDKFSKNEFSKIVRFFEDHADGLRFIYSKIGTGNNLFFTKPNTRIKKLSTIFNFKVACKRDMLFFFENVVFNPKDRVFNLFYLLKYEILGFRNLSRNTLISASYEQIQSLEKCAVLIEGSVLLEHVLPSEEVFSFDGMLSFFITIDSLKSDNQYGQPISNFVLMPNFLMNINESNGRSVFQKLVAKGLILHLLNIPMKRWPDKKIGEYLFRIVTGKFAYYQLLKFIFIKIFFVKKYVFLIKMHIFLEQKLKDIKYD